MNKRGTKLPRVHAGSFKPETSGFYSDVVTKCAINVSCYIFQPFYIHYNLNCFGIKKIKINSEITVRLQPPAIDEPSRQQEPKNPNSPIKFQSNLVKMERIITILGNGDSIWGYINSPISPFNPSQNHSRFHPKSEIWRNFRSRNLLTKLNTQKPSSLHPESTHVSKPSV